MAPHSVLCDRVLADALSKANRALSIRKIARKRRYPGRKKSAQLVGIFNQVHTRSQEAGPLPRITEIKWKSTPYLPPLLF